MTAKNETEINQEIQQKIAISMIGSGTIEKQFIHNYLDKNPSATTGEITEAYKHFVGDVTRAYRRARYGSKKLVRYLYEAYNITITEKTVLSWLIKHGVTIRPPTRERERILHSRWERERVREIEGLTEAVESLQKRYDSSVGELVACESKLRICEKENISLIRRLEGCEQEVKEIILGG